MNEKLFRFDRVDAIATRIVLLLTVLGVAWFSLVLPVVDWVRNRPMTLVVPAPVEAELGVKGLDVKSGSLVEAVDQLQVTLKQPTTSLRMLDLGSGLLLLVGVLLGAWLVYRLLGRIMAGEPFSPRTVWWVRGLAAVLLLWPCLLFPLNLALTGAALGEAVDTSGMTVSFQVPMMGFGFMVVGLLVAAIGEAFVRGAQLRQDSEGLV